MKITIESAEEQNENTTLLLSNGHKVVFPTSKLIDYIVVNELNVTVESCGSGLMCDPECREWSECKVVEPSAYLDSEWDSVCEMYYRNVVLKVERELSVNN